MSAESSTIGPAEVDHDVAYRKRPAFRNKLNQQILPDFGYVFFGHLKAEYENELISCEDEKILDKIKQINEKSRSLLTWSDVYCYESILLKLVDKSKLSRKVWDLRSRYRDIVGIKEYETYLASKSPETSGQVEENELRADTEFLLNKIYLHYTLMPYNEKMRSSISRKVTILVLIGLAFIILTGVLDLLDVNVFKGEAFQPVTILIVLFAGAMGGLMSMLQRHNSLVREGDLINNITIQSWYQILVPAINGSLFAALLFMIFIGKLIDGILFPNIAGPKAGNDGIGITDLLTDFRPVNGVDYAKLIVWGFIAGFAERFVPDTLSRIITKKEKEGKTTDDIA